MGGVTGALAKHAEETLDMLSPEEVHIAQLLLLRLVTPQKTKRSMSKEQLLEGLGPKAEEILRLLTSACIVVARRVGRARRETMPRSTSYS